VGRGCRQRQNKKRHLGSDAGTPIDVLSITVIGVGRMGKGPETDLCDTYLDRIQKLPRKWAVKNIEIDDRKAPRDTTRKAWDMQQLQPYFETGGTAIALDERGKTLNSAVFSKHLETLEREAAPVSFIIGGPDGLHPNLQQKADLTLCLGAMTWPHKLVRALILEQIYRAGTILSGHPYHRE